MAKYNEQFLAFNRGRISTKALARIDLDRTRLSSEVQTNFIPSTLGAASVRPGLEFTGSRISVGGTGLSISIPFVFSQDDQAELEFTNVFMRPWVDDELIDGGGGALSTTILNRNFDSNLTNWTDADESGAASAWATGGYMALLGTGTNSAIRYQLCTTSVSQNVKHTLSISIARGPVVLKVGSSAGANDYAEYTLKTGWNYIGFIPTAAAEFYVQFSSALDYTVLVDSCGVVGSSDLKVVSPFLEADLYNIRWIQSADVVYLACDGYRPHMVERRDNDSWSLVQLEPEDGPFGVINTSEITMTPSDISGDITLTTNKAYWTTGTGHVGELIKLVSSGQNVVASVTAENSFTDSIYVTGIGTGRVFAISITNTFTATVTLQRSEDDASWEDVTTYTAVTATVFDDTLDNQQWYYRIGVKTGDFGTGQADLLLSYNGGSRVGIAKITSITSTTVANAVVLSHLGSTAATEFWYRSQWSDLLGYPSSVTLFESRLFLAGKGRVWGSVIDAYLSFDDELTDDTGPINRILGSDAFDTIFWMLALDRLLLGNPKNTVTCKSNLFDEPLTPTNFNSKRSTGEGSANVAAIEDGQTGVFVERSRQRLFQLAYASDSNNYTAIDLTSLIPEIGDPGIIRIAIQKNPDTRIHCVRSDGTVAVLVKDDAEKVIAWVDVETEGEVLDAYVFPAKTTEIEDRVYYTVRRGTFEFREKWALEADTLGTSTSAFKLLDSFEYFPSPGTATIDIAANHYTDGDILYAWVDGVLEGPFTYSSATKQVVISTDSATHVYIGYPYSWQWKSVKLAYGADFGTALLQPKRVNQLGLIAENLHPTAFQYGQDFTTMYDLPAVEGGQVIDADTIRTTYDEFTFPFDGTWDSDSRICLKGAFAKPCTLLGMVFNIATHSKD